MNSLSNKVAIVTGASSGIGKAAASLFAKEGARVVVSARRKGVLDELVAAIEQDGGHAVAVAGDIRHEQTAKTLVDTAVERFGGLDIAFNNAGGSGAMGPIGEVSPEGFRDTIETNLTSGFLGATYQVPAMIERGGGSLIFTSTFVGHSVAFPEMAAYASAKAGLIALTRVIAVETSAQGVRANAILPGGIDTPSNHANAPGAAPEVRDFVEGLHAMKRMGRAEEVARAALYLASDASSFMTGAAMAVDGGVSITRT